MFERKTAILGVLMLALAVVGLPAFAGSHDDATVQVNSDVRVRFDHVEDYDFDSTNDDNANAWLYRAIVGLTGNLTDDVSATVELQAFGDLGNQFGPQSGLTGYSYGSAGSGFDVDNVDVYQAVITLADMGGSDWTLNAGRREFTMGRELHFGDNDFGNGRTFDGAWLDGDMDGWDLGFMFLNVNETNSLNFSGGAGSSADDDSWILAAHAAFDVGEGTIQPYIINWRNGQDGDGTLPLFANRIDLQTVGALWQMPGEGDGSWDASAEFAMQLGDLGSGTTKLDLGGNVFEGEVGYSFSDHSRAHLGYLQASGDDNAGDLDFDAFVQIAPELTGSRLGYADNSLVQLTNVTDLSLGYEHGWNDGGNTLAITLHMLSLAEDNLAGEDEIGKEIDLVYNYKYSKNATFEFGVAKLFAGDALGVTADDAMRAWTGLQVSWGN